MRSNFGISGDELRTRHSEETQDLKRKIRLLESNLADYKKAHGSITTLFESVKDAIPLYPPRPIVYKPSKAKRSDCGVCLLISDVHYGAVQVASEIEGFGEYSPDICVERCNKFVNEVCRWVDLQRSAYNIDTAHVLVAGDLISGDIHEELRITNAFPVTQQVVGAASILAGQLCLLAQNFSKVNVHFVVADNHARLTKKPQAKEEGINSFNYLVGAMAKIMVQTYPNVKFNIYPQHEAVVTVENRNYLLCHGHNMTAGFAGIAWYGVERKVAKEAIKRINEIASKRFHKIIMAHYHTPISAPRFWIGGSVSGTDAYDHKFGRHAEPSQASWLVNRHGEFSRVDWKL